MSNLTPIEIFTGINDTPTAPTSQEGCNGSYLVRKVNDLIGNQNKPTTFWDDSGDSINFYIDTVDGDDANDGLTELTPKQSWEGLLPILKTKTFTDNWNTYVNIKGEFVGEKDFSDLYSWNNSDRQEGFFYLKKWDSETDNWIWRSVTEGPDDYVPKRLIKPGFYTPGFEIDNCDFICETGITFDNLVFYIDNSSNFIPSGEYVSYYCLHFHRCVIYNLPTINFSQLIDRNYVIDFFDCTLRGNQIQVLLGTNTELGFRFQYSRIKIGSCFHSLCTTNTFTINANSTNTIQAANKDSLRGITLNGNPNVIYDEVGLEYLGESLFFPTLADGRYKVWIPPRACRLIEWRLSASAGSGTFQMDMGVGFPYGDPLTQTFTSAYEDITRDMNFDVPFRGAFSFYLNVSASSGLTNVYLQLLYRDW